MENMQFDQENAYRDDAREGRYPEREEKRGAGRFWLRVVCAALVIGLLGGGVTYMIAPKAQEAPKVASAGTVAIPKISVQRAMGAGDILLTSTTSAGEEIRPGTVASVAENAMPAMVAITSKTVQEVRSFFGGGFQTYEADASGSGIIVGQTDSELLIATNYHVVENSNGLTVAFVDDSAAPAVIKGSDRLNDLAVISVELSAIGKDTLDAIRIIEIGDSNALVLGEQVVAIGNALGYGQSVTSGYVSALNREITIDGVTKKLIQTDAAINPGNSGGALLNMKGQLIGINEAKSSMNAVEGMGYAIPVATAEPIITNLMNRVTRAKVSEEQACFMGISCMDVSEEARRFYGLPAGAYVAEVSKDSPADKAGIIKGDIITRFDGISLSSSSELLDTLTYYAAGETVQLTVARSNRGVYEEEDLTITLGSKAEMAKAS